MTRPVVLDLFCGAGGAAMGYYRAGFDVIGVDSKPQPHYPFEFHQMDWLTGYIQFRKRVDLAHASPPCQRYSLLAYRHGNQESYPDLVNEVRATISTLQYVIENVPHAPLRADLVLCGSMFGLGAGGRQLRRHRVFESSALLSQPEHNHAGATIGVYGNGGPSPKARGYSGYADECREAMGMDWCTKRELSQAIPPAYTEYIGRQLLNG